MTHVSKGRRFGISGLALVMAGCGSTSDFTGAPPDGVAATPSSQVATVVDVTWTTTVPSVGYVEYGATPEYGMNTPLEVAPTTTHSVPLLGLDADTEYFYRVVTWAQQNAAVGGASSFRTGALPASLPALTLQANQFDRFVAVPVSGVPPAVAIVNPEGRIVWYHLDSRGLELYRVRFGLDGASILYSAASPTAALQTPGVIVRVGFDGTETVVATLPSLAGDFVERSDGTIAAVVAEVRDIGGVATRGDSIVEIDANGVQTAIWSASNCFDPSLHPAVVADAGWAVVDTLQLDPTNEAYYVGLASLGSVARVSRAAGSCDWIFGQTAATVTWGEGVAPIAGLRQIEVAPDGVNTRITLVDTNADGTLRGAEYKFNPATQGPATLSWSTLGPIAASGGLRLGQPSRLTNTKVLVNWAAEGRLQVIDFTGAVTWDVMAPAGVRFGLHAHTEALYVLP